MKSDWGSWNADMVKAGDLLVARGIPAELDTSEVFVGGRSESDGLLSWGQQ